MAALVPTVPTIGGVVAAPAAVAASDTISGDVMGPRGAALKIINGNASPDSMTISDASATPSGAAAAANAPSVTNATSKWFLIRREMLNPATNVVTVTHSVTATVTYELIPLP